MKKLTVILPNDPSSKAPSFLENLKQQSFQNYDIIYLSREESFQSILASSLNSYVTCLDPFDQLAPDRFEKIMQLAEKKPGPQWFFTEVRWIDLEGKILSIHHPLRRAYEGELMRGATQYPSVGFQLLDYHLPVALGNLVFHRDLFPLLQGSFQTKEDTSKQFTLRALQEVEPCWIPEFLYSFRHISANPYNPIMHEHPSYREYLYQACEKAFKNALAPSPWSWPRFFSKEHLRVELPPSAYPALSRPVEPTSTNPCKENSPPLPSSEGKPITLIAHELSLSGAPKLISDLAYELKKKGYNPQIISLKQGPLEQELQERGIAYTVLPLKIFQGLFSPSKRKKLLAIGKLLLWAYINVSGPILGNSLMSWPLMLPLIFGMPHKTFYWYIHESFSPLAVLPKMLSDQKLAILQNPERVQFWFGSESTRQLWKDYGFDGFCFYWSGLQAQEIKKREPKKPKHLLAVGTASTRKGTHDLIEAFITGVQEKKIESEAVLKIIGFPPKTSDPYLQDLAEKVFQAHLTDRIQLIPSLDHAALKPFYEEADIFIQPSLNECLPLTLLQAMSMGKTVVTTDTFGCKEAIENDVSGYVCPPRQPGALLEKIRHALENVEKSCSMGEEAHRRFQETFSLEVTSQKIIAHLENHTESASKLDFEALSV